MATHDNYIVLFQPALNIHTIHLSEFWKPCIGGCKDTYRQFLLYSWMWTPTVPGAVLTEQSSRVHVLSIFHLYALILSASQVAGAYPSSNWVRCKVSLYVSPEITNQRLPQRAFQSVKNTRLSILRRGQFFNWGMRIRFHILLKSAKVKGIVDQQPWRITTKATLPYWNVTS